MVAGRDLNPRPWDYDSCSTSNDSIGYRRHVARMSHQRGLYWARSLSVPLSLEAAGIEFIEEDDAWELFHRGARDGDERGSDRRERRLKLRFSRSMFPFVPGYRRLGT
jgi:hypothetical protein